MIILIEPQCVGWQHESVNAGFIECIERNIGKEQIKVYAEKEHIHCLRQLLPNIEKEILFQAINVPQKRLNWAGTFPSYYRLFREILCNGDNINVRMVFLLSCNKANLIAIREMAKRLKKIRFHIVMHAIAEQLVNKKMVPKYTIISFKHILKTFSENDNVRFITYSPVAREVLSTILKREIVDKMLFLHHPFPTSKPDVDEMQEVDKDGKVHIAIWGACVRQDVYDFIKSIDQEMVGKVEFDILERSQIDFSDLQSVRVLKKGGDITNIEITRLLRKSQFIFLPYTHKEYQIFCSGILIEAIRQTIPILAFDSNLIVWYNQHHIGIVCRTYDEMRDHLMKLCGDTGDSWTIYRQNMVELSKKIINENDNKISQICQCGCTGE